MGCVHSAPDVHKRLAPGRLLSAKEAARYRSTSCSAAARGECAPAFYECTTCKRHGTYTHGCATCSLFISWSCSHGSGGLN